MQSSNIFLNTVKTQSRVIGALLMREIIIRYGRNNIGFLWLVVEPVLFTLGITVLWSALKLTHNSNMPITAFALTGYATVLLWRNTANRCALAIRANGGLLYHSHVQVIHLLIARILLEIAGVTTSFVVLTLFFISMDWMAPPANILVVILGWILLAWFGAALALIIGAISERYETIDRLWHTIAYLLFPLSGAAFMVEWLPKQAQDLILLLPMVNGVELLRDGIFGSTVPTHYSITYLTCSCLVLSLFGLFLTNEASKHIGSE